MKNCSSSAMSEDDVVISMGVVCKSFRVLRRMFSVTFYSSPEKKSAADLTEPAVSAILKFNCNTQSHAFRKFVGMAFARKTLVTNLLFVKTLVGFDASHKMSAN